MAVRHALEDILDVGVGLDIVELGRGEKRGDDGPTICAAIGAGEQMVLSSERDGPNLPLDRVVVELDAAIVEEPAQSAGQRASA